MTEKPVKECLCLKPVFCSTPSRHPQFQNTNKVLKMNPNSSPLHSSMQTLREPEVYRLLRSSCLNAVFSLFIYTSCTVSSLSSNISISLFLSPLPSMQPVLSPILTDYTASSLNYTDYAASSLSPLLTNAAIPSPLLTDNQFSLLYGQRSQFS